MSGGVDPDASVAPGGEVQSRSGGAAFAASGDLGAEALWRSDGPWSCALGGAFLKTRRPVVTAGASQWMSGGLGRVATDGASLQRNDELGLVASG